MAEQRDPRDLYECIECSSKPATIVELCDRCADAREAAGSAWRGPRPNGLLFANEGAEGDPFDLVDTREKRTALAEAALAVAGYATAKMPDEAYRRMLEQRDHNNEQYVSRLSAEVSDLERDKTELCLRVRFLEGCLRDIVEARYIGAEVRRIAAAALGEEPERPQGEALDLRAELRKVK